MANDFLKQIIETKKEEVAAAKKMVPESILRKKAAISRENRSFFNQLKQPGPSGINIIAEIKRASPSLGPIHPDLNPSIYAEKYETGGAAAISVLTDKTYFQGSFEDLRMARNAVSLPVLRKDFMISSYQLYESAVLGADAILLIVRILSGEQLRDYIKLSHELGLDALVEVNSEKDLDSASRANAELIGINNRNLSSFETDINTAMNISSLLEPQQVAVAASGIRDRNDIEKNKEFGIYNFLIGESLVKAENPVEFIGRLQGNR